MLMKRPEGSDPGWGAYHQGSAGRGKGFFDAPLWRLLLWAGIFIAVLVLVEQLGIVG
jgi:hypothetical protein